MEGLAPDTLSLIARICLVIIFPFSALDKIFNWTDALAQANSGILPGGPVLLVLAMSLEIAAPVCIVTGWQAGWAALLLAAYCVVTALLYHQFWAYPRFWRPQSEGFPHVWDFLKNFGLVGGLLLVVLASGVLGSAG